MPTQKEEKAMTIQEQAEYIANLIAICGNVESYGASASRTVRDEINFQMEDLRTRIKGERDARQSKSNFLDRAKGRAEDKAGEPRRS